jgi:ribonucleoside-diphosphate reductase beta chain
LIFLDSIQTNNIPNISSHISSPEIKLILSIHSYQEAIHSQSYATILESVVDSDEREKIYNFWRTDNILLSRNEYICGIYEEFINNKSNENFFRAVVANFLLEGIYFYNGFAFFDTLVDSGRMQATGRMIAYIRRDELTHLAVFANIIRAIKTDTEGIYDKQVIYDMM